MMGGFGGCCGYGWLGGIGGFGWIGWALSFLIPIVFVIGVVAFILLLVRKASANSETSYRPAEFATKQSSPQELLAVRYATGEIDRDEFKRMVSDLK